MPFVISRKPFINTLIFVGILKNDSRFSTDAEMQEKKQTNEHTFSIGDTDAVIAAGISEGEKTSFCELFLV